jgi:hypothetical protein
MQKQLQKQKQKWGERERERERFGFIWIDQKSEIEIDFFFFQNEATFPLVRKDYYIISTRRLIHTSGDFLRSSKKRMSLLTLPCGLT